MSVTCFDWTSIGKQGDAWISHHKLRYRIFVERCRWEVGGYNGMEYDQYDTPAAKYFSYQDSNGQALGTLRLSPTTRPYMLERYWPALVDIPAPKSEQIWEASRFGCDPELPAEQRKKIKAELLCAVHEFALENDIEHYAFLMCARLIGPALIDAGCDIRRLGVSKKLGAHKVQAGYLIPTVAALAQLRDKGGLPQPLSGIGEIAA